jgi:hypothetical protein
MSEPESGPGSVPEGHECEEGEIWDEVANKCVPIEQASAKDPSATGKVVESLGLTKRIERTVSAYFDLIEKKLDEKIEEKMKKIVAQKEKDVETQLRKSFGLDKDPVVHVSDLERFARKAKLATAEGTKRTPASPGEAGPEGNIDASKSKQTNTIESLMKQYGVKK